MAALKLSAKQAEFMAKCLTDKVLGMMEEKGGAFAESTPQDVIDLWNEMAPVVAVIGELSKDQQTENLDLLLAAAGEARGEAEDSIGHEVIAQREIEGGAVVEHLAGEDESAEDAIKRCQQEVAYNVERGYMALSVAQAVELAQLEARVAAGDGRAREGLAARERWAAENRKLAEAKGEDQ